MENVGVARIGLVLGAGGVVGEAFHAGVLAALSEVTGFDPRTAHHLLGTSAGSVAAASLRAGASAGDLYARATGRPLSPEGRSLFEAPDARSPSPAPSGGGPGGVAPARIGPASPELLGRLVARPMAVRPALAVAALLPEGRRDAASWFRGFDSWFSSWPSDDGCQLWVCAVDLGSGERVVFGRRGSPAVPVSQAVQASCAIPAVYQPVRIGSRRYVDGGVHSPTNADLCAGEPLDAVIVSSPMSAVRPAGIPAFSADRLRLAARLPARRALERELAVLARAGVPVLAFEPTLEVIDAMGLQPMDFRRRGPVAEAAFQAARRLLYGPAGREVGQVLRRR
jgi:NTE family protein